MPVGRAFSLDIEAMVALGVARQVASLGFTGTGYHSSTHEDRMIHQLVVVVMRVMEGCRLLFIV